MKTDVATTIDMTIEKFNAATANEKQTCCDRNNLLKARKRG